MRRAGKMLLGVTTLLALAFLAAWTWESTGGPCRPEEGCIDERLATPMAGFVATLMCLASLALGMRTRHRALRVFASLPCAIALMLALVVVRAQVDEWILPLWWPLVVVSLADAAFLVVSGVHPERA